MHTVTNQIKRKTENLQSSGILDTNYKPVMTDEEARKLGRRAIMHATYRDAGSGGVCNSRDFYY